MQLKSSSLYDGLRARRSHQSVLCLLIFDRVSYSNSKVAWNTIAKLPKPVPAYKSNFVAKSRPKKSIEFNEKARTARKNQM